MDLRHLRTAVVLAEELHFGRAAKRLHVVQSAVSQTIKALEADVGAPLFTRTKRTVLLTEAGEALVARARKLLDDVREIPVQVRSVASGEAGQLWGVSHTKPQHRNARLRGGPHGRKESLPGRGRRPTRKDLRPTNAPVPSEKPRGGPGDDTEPQRRCQTTPR